ncbi:thioredoxin family protein [Halobacteriales archaeon QS_1_68_20]|nr:MAG: thioredoxin family protein [Halobacteriales archaeon QS_1_68_20]
MAGESIQQIERGEPALSFELEGVDGETHTLADYSDYAAALIVFTCNHCPYAQAKFDLLNDVAEEYDDVAVIGINPNDAEQYPDDDFETMREWVEEGRVRYDAYLRDDTQEIAKAYGAVCTPDPFLFENTGDEFRLVYHGRLDDALNPDDEPTEFYVRDAIDSVLAGEDVGLEFMPSRGCSIKWQPGNEPDYWDDL